MLEIFYAHTNPNARIRSDERHRQSTPGRLFFGGGGLGQGKAEDDAFDGVERTSRAFQVFETMLEVVSRGGDPVKRIRLNCGEQRPCRQNRDHICLANHAISKTTFVTPTLVGTTGQFGLGFCNKFMWCSLIESATIRLRSGLGLCHFTSTGAIAVIRFLK